MAALPSGSLSVQVMRKLWSAVSSTPSGSMTVMVGVFTLRYADGVLAGVLPAMRFDPVWLFSSSVASGFLASLVIARCRAQVQYLRLQAGVVRA